MNRIGIINALIQKHGYKKYLEIGVRDGSCINAINCDVKVGVDPDKGSAATIFETSDEFFSKNPYKFDIIFIDGLHHSDQVEKDIENSLNALAEGGTIVMHDCLPTTEFMQLIPLTNQNEWTGDTWKAFVRKRAEKEDVEMFVVDTDWGCGIITKGKQEKLDLQGQDLIYANFLRNRDVWMNRRTVDWFINFYLK